MSSTLWLPRIGRLFYSNLHEALMLYKDVFWTEEYRFSPENNAPFIIDCGSHIGTSILYFKYRFPNAQIVGFEPNPRSFALLTQNIAAHHLDDVLLINAGLAADKGMGKLFVAKGRGNQFTWGDSMVQNAWYPKDKTVSIEVSTVRLSTSITKPVDLLKMDIEGAELMVLLEIEKKLHLVKQMIIEYHGGILKKSALRAIKALLEKNGFMLTLKHPGGDMYSSVPTDTSFVMLHAKRPERIAHSGH